MADLRTKAFGPFIEPILMVLLLFCLSTGGFPGAAWAQGVDLTFFVCADVHVGDVNEADNHENQIAAMNALPGKPWPEGFSGATVDEPRGVLVAGELTNTGIQAQWNRFVALYGLDGTDGTLEFPVYEGYGNHDLSSGRTIVKNGIIARHGTLHRSYDWEGVHIVQCNLYPGSTAGASGSSPITAAVSAAGTSASSSETVAVSVPGASASSSATAAVSAPGASASSSAAAARSAGGTIGVSDGATDSSADRAGAKAVVGSGAGGRTS